VNSASVHAPPHQRYGLGTSQRSVSTGRLHGADQRVFRGAANIQATTRARTTSSPCWATMNVDAEELANSAACSREIVYDARTARDDLAVRPRRLSPRMIADIEAHVPGNRSWPEGGASGRNSSASAGALAGSGQTANATSIRTCDLAGRHGEGADRELARTSFGGFPMDEVESSGQHHASLRPSFQLPTIVESYCGMRDR